MYFLSIIILAKDEEANIANCIESVLAATKNIKGTEIILVDSCSTDQTIEIAKQYPINIIQLGKDWPHSPTAGAFTGVNNTSSKYIMVIDGDMKVLEGWIESALIFMEDNPKTALVMGKLYNVYTKNDGSSLKPQLHLPSDCNEAQKVDFYFGSPIMRRSSLNEAGNYQPFVRAEEEAELSYRLTKSGYELYLLPHDSIYHHTIKPRTLKETVRRTKSNLYSGIGDMASWCLRNKNYSILWKRCKSYILYIMLIVTSTIGGAISILLHNIVLGIFFFLQPFIFLLLMCCRKKSLSKGFFSTLSINIISINVFLGLFRRINCPSDYPTKVIWIKKI